MISQEPREPRVEANRVLRTLVIVVCVLAALALLIATIGAGLALLTGHTRWIELTWLSIAASLFVLVVSRVGSTHL